MRTQQKKGLRFFSNNTKHNMQNKENKVNIFSYALKLQLQENSLKVHNLKNRIEMRLKRIHLRAHKRHITFKGNKNDVKRKKKKFKTYLNKITQKKLFFKINRFIKMKKIIKRTKKSLKYLNKHVLTKNRRRFLLHIFKTRKLFKNKPYKYKERKIKIKINKKAYKMDKRVTNRRAIKYKFQKDIMSWKLANKKKRFLVNLKVKKKKSQNYLFVF